MYTYFITIIQVKVFFYTPTFIPLLMFCFRVSQWPYSIVCYVRRAYVRVNQYPKIRIIDVHKLFNYFLSVLE